MAASSAALGALLQQPQVELACPEELELDPSEQAEEGVSSFPGPEGPWTKVVHSEEAVVHGCQPSRQMD